MRSFAHRGEALALAGDADSFISPREIPARSKAAASLARIICFVRVFAWTTICVALASALAAADAASIAEPVKILVLSIVTASGPVGGWVLAIHRQAFPSAYEVLVPATVLCFAPIALAVLVRQPGWFVLAGLFWFFAGWYFAIGMWI